VPNVKSVWHQLYNYYSPMLNPIEEFFSKFKRLIKRKPTKNEAEIIKAVEDSFPGFTKKDFKGYIRNTLKYVENSLSLIDM